MTSIVSNILSFLPPFSFFLFLFFVRVWFPGSSRLHIRLLGSVGSGPLFHHLECKCKCRRRCKA